MSAEVSALREHRRWAEPIESEVYVGWQPFERQYRILQARFLRFAWDGFPENVLVGGVERNARVFRHKCRVETVPLAAPERQSAVDSGEVKSALLCSVANAAVFESVEFLLPFAGLPGEAVIVVEVLLPSGVTVALRRLVDGEDCCQHIDSGTQSDSRNAS